MVLPPVEGRSSPPVSPPRARAELCGDAGQPPRHSAFLPISHPLIPNPCEQDGDAFPKTQPTQPYATFPGGIFTPAPSPVTPAVVKHSPSLGHPPSSGRSQKQHQGAKTSQKLTFLARDAQCSRRRFANGPSPTSCLLPIAGLGFAPSAVPTTAPPGVPIHPSPVSGGSRPVTLLLELPLSAVGCFLPRAFPPNQLCSCFPLGFGD